MPADLSPNPGFVVAHTVSKPQADEAGSLDNVASLVEKLAVLLSAGVPPAAAWMYLADAVSDEPCTVVAVATDINSGTGIAAAILRSTDRGTLPPQGRSNTKAIRARISTQATAWRGLAAAWFVATETGAPLAQALREFSSSLRALAQARRAAATALSGPVATAKLVMVLPVVGILFGMALGFDTVEVLFTTPPGIACLVVGGALLLVARAWNQKLVRAATPTDLTPGLALDLLAVAVSGGVSIERARATVATAFERSGFVAASDGSREADAVFDLSRRAGVPAGTLLRSEAERIRREAISAADRQAATLAVTLMVPLGLCILPAFMLLGVAPLMISILSSTVGGI